MELFQKDFFTLTKRNRMMATGFMNYAMTSDVMAPSITFAFEEINEEQIGDLCEGFQQVLTLSKEIVGAFSSLFVSQEPKMDELEMPFQTGIHTTCTQAVLALMEKSDRKRRRKTKSKHKKGVQTKAVTHHRKISNRPKNNYRIPRVQRFNSREELFDLLGSDE